VGTVAEYPFCPLLPKFGCDLLKNTQNNSVIPAFFQLRLARILKACPQKSIRQQSPVERGGLDILFSIWQTNDVIETIQNSLFLGSIMRKVLTLVSTGG